MPDAPDEIVVACMMMALRRKMGNQPQAIFDSLDRELTAALRTLRERPTSETLDSGWKN